MGGGGGVEVALFGEVLRNASGEGVVAFYPGLAGPAGDLVVSVLVRWPEGVVGVEGSGRGDETDCSSWVHNGAWPQTRTLGAVCQGVANEIGGL